METCILMPTEFSLVLRMQPGANHAMEMFVDVWSNEAIPRGTVFRPDQGKIRLDRVEVYSKLEKDDVRFKFGCYDEILTVSEREVRHCNWIRFVKSSDCVDDVNIVAVIVKEDVVYQVIKDIRPNDEIVVLFETEERKKRADITQAETNEVPEQEKSPEIEKKNTSGSSSSIISPASIGHRGLITSPLSREDDCRSSLSDVTSGGEESDRLDRTKSESDITTESSPEFPVCTERPIKRNRERTWLPCEVCGKKFDRPSLLKRHMRTHTGEKPHACDVCGKAFSTSSSLNTHRRIHSGEKPHQCKVCGKRFTASSNLYYHRMTHNKEKPHKCTLCSKSFPTPGDLRSHMYVHSGSWPFKCDVCNRGFSKQTNLKNHLLLHTGDKPHECKACGKKFALQCNLKTHMKTHESDNNEECSRCGKLFVTSPSSSSSPETTTCPQCLTSPPEQTGAATRKRPTDFSISRLTESTPKRPSQTSPRSLVPDFGSDVTASPSSYDRSPPYFANRFMAFPGHSALSPILPHGNLAPPRYLPGLPPLNHAHSIPLSAADHMKLFSMPSERFPVDSRIFGSDVISQRQSAYWSNILTNSF